MGRSDPFLGIFLLAIFISSVRADYPDDSDEILKYKGIFYLICFVINALVAAGVALCCVHCDCCPYYRGRGRNAQAHMAQAQSMEAGAGPNGTAAGYDYGSSPNNPSAPYPTTATPMPATHSSTDIPPPYFSGKQEEDRRVLLEPET